MSKKISSMENLINLFEDYVNEDDIVASNILSAISSEIVKYRLESGMSQKEFAAFLNVSQSMISKIESSDYNFTIKMLVKICNKMNKKLNINFNDINKSCETYYIININEHEEYKSMKTTSLFGKQKNNKKSYKNYIREV